MKRKTMMIRLIAIAALALASLSFTPRAHAGVTCAQETAGSSATFLCTATRSSNPHYWVLPNFMAKVGSEPAQNQIRAKCVAGDLSPTWDSGANGGAGGYVQNVKTDAVHYQYSWWIAMYPYVGLAEDAPAYTITCLGDKPALTPPATQWQLVYIVYYTIGGGTPTMCGLSWVSGGYCGGIYYPPNW